MNATAWYYVGLLVLLVVLCVGISVLPLKQEGFGDVGAYYAMGTDLNSRMQKGATDGIFTNNDYPLDPNGINRALNTPDLYNTTTIPNDYSTIFTTDPAGMYTDAEKNFCRGATDPRSLPATNNQKVRCGWLYVDDPGRQSMGAIGTWNGPLFPENSPAGSVWYWDLAAAAKKEDIKYCKRLTSCTLMDAFNAGGTRRCGFCPWGMGHGVPVDSAGRALYSDDTTASCDSMVTQSNQCPAPGETSGSGSESGSGSSSDACDQRDSAGNITSACILRLGKQAGMSDRGAYLNAVANETTSKQLRYAMDVVLASYKVADLYTDPATALQYFMRIVQAQTTGATQSIRDAAAYVASGSNDFDFCPTDPKATGPFELTCVQRAFREKGCQPAGSSYPKTAADATAASLMSWGDLNTQYTGIQLATQSSDPTVQRPALKQCLGVDMPLPPPPKCSGGVVTTGGSNPTLQGFANPVVEGFADSFGWLPMDGWVDTIAIGADGTVCAVNAVGGPYMRRSTKDPWAYMYASGVKSIDCASKEEVVATMYNGDVVKYIAGGWYPAGIKDAVYATIAHDGSIAYMVSAGGTQFTFNLVSEGSTKQAGRGLWVSLGPTSKDMAIVTAKGTVTTSQGSLENPPGVTFAKVFVSKSDGAEMIAITTDARLFGLDYKQKWSELPNPTKVNYVGVNYQRILGCKAGVPPQDNVFTKLILANTPTDDFKRVPGTMANGTSSIAATKKGIEQVKRECRETPSCVGINYTTTGDNASLVLGKELSRTPRQDYSYYSFSGVRPAQVNSALSQPWTVDPGPNNRLATIAVGDDKSVIGTSPGQTIWSSTVMSGTYTQVRGMLVQIDAKSSSLCVGVGSDAVVYQRVSTGTGWIAIGVRAKWVSIGVDGTLVCVSTDGSIWRYLGTPNQWESIPGIATQVSVGNRSTMWCVNAMDQVFRWNGGGWDLVPGALRRVAVSGTGRVAGINAQGIVHVYSSSSSSWTPIPGPLGGPKAVNLSISASYIAITTDQSMIYFKNG